ncbi:unnamed protein product [Adineta ricciae]|uniref:Uncharacterized protein n=1 Tax=Adineta ricciae TaxID=249248 RepID=A0A814ZCU6_ADIRI|nr:unnamed protein product [Adineta ricciae]CAF1240218.1 unnamed protein product [Adineta ricciae]
MSYTGIKKSPLGAIPFLKKRLRRITALGLRNLTINDLNFSLYFTLHRTEQSVAFYTSEAVENQRSPEWSHLEFPLSVQCLQDFLMRVWITSSNICRLFLEYDVHLDDSLVPDGQKDDSPVCNNSLWLEMFGYQFTDNPSTASHQAFLQQISRDASLAEKKTKRSNFVKSYNKSSILRMISAIDAIRNEKRLANECLQRLQTLADENEEYLSRIKERESRRLQIEHLLQYIYCQTSINDQQSTINQQRHRIVNERRNQLDQDLLQLLHQQKELKARISELNQSKYFLYDLIKLTTFRQKTIIDEIYHQIYPIVSDKKNEYSIANVRLPTAQDKIYQTTLTRERENEIGAAVGYCAHFVLIISQFLQLPLRFPIEFNGAATIKIHDYTLPSSDFPLYPSYDMNSFQYGFFLLNRDIGQLMYHCRAGGRNTDYRKTLVNLKELLEQYFTNRKRSQSVQVYTLNQSTIEPIISDTSMSIDERVVMRNKTNLSENSIFSPSRSASSSFLESNDLIHNEDNNHRNDVNLFPNSSAISPRLMMQISVQPQQQ